MNAATMTIHYNSDPREIVVVKPAGDWLCLDKLLVSLGFRQVRDSGHLVPGKFSFVTGSAEEQDQVAEIVRLGGGYLTSGNFETTFSI